MADREQDALTCAARRRYRKAHPVSADLYVCRCDHDHPPEVTWCDLCEYPLPVVQVTVDTREAEGAIAAVTARLDELDCGRG